MIRAILTRYSLIIMIAFVVSATPAFGYDGVPTWLTQAASSGAPVYEKDVPIVVLHTEQVSTIGNDGKLVTVTNYAIKVLTRDGRRFAVAREYYLASSGKIREINAWLIRPDGTTKQYDKKSIVDVISDDEDVYNEGRIKMIDATDDVEVGSIFGYTSESEESPLFFQDRWEFQSRFPTIRSRFSLNLPTGWTA